jgi:hypothetical protein
MVIQFPGIAPKQPGGRVIGNVPASALKRSLGKWASKRLNADAGNISHFVHYAA